LTFFFFLFCTGHMLGVAASWLVQVGIDLYRFFSSAFKVQNKDNDVDKTNEVGVLGQKIFITTVRCTSSLIFASIGAGIGATLVRPSLGQWIGKIVELLQFCNLRSYVDKLFYKYLKKRRKLEDNWNKLFFQITINFWINQFINLELILLCFTSIGFIVSSFSSGCAAGDLAGPIIVAFCADQLLQVKLWRVISSDTVFTHLLQITGVYYEFCCIW